MKRALLFGAFVALACLALPAVHGDAQADSKKKVRICHYTIKTTVEQSEKCERACEHRGAGHGKLRCTQRVAKIITVDASAVAAHLAHGDHVAHKKGGCKQGRRTCRCECTGGGNDGGMMK
ncbi:MAG: hypothetical protein P1V36_17195 [Planctomycetota bacterium]|nr:hypothetical protein [Planctomycetota bacterium]